MEATYYLRDPVSSLTHLFTSVFAVFVTLILWRLSRGDRVKRISLAVFGLSAVALYAASGTYHAIPLPKTSPVVDFFRRLDHSAIYLLIAGTYTPVYAVLLSGRRRVVMLSLVWSLAFTGIAVKWLAPLGGSRLTIALYLALGWMVLASGFDLLRSMSWSGLSWVAAGGLAYSVAAMCEWFHWPVIIPGVLAWHETCHVLDMVGTACHLVFMIRCVVPYRLPTIGTTAPAAASVAA